MTEELSEVTRVMAKRQACCGWVDYIRVKPVIYVWVHASRRTLRALAKLPASVLLTACNKWLCPCSISSLWASTTEESLLHSQLPARWLQIHTFPFQKAPTMQILQDGTHRVSTNIQSVSEKDISPKQTAFCVGSPPRIKRIIAQRAEQNSFMRESAEMCL